MSKSKLRNLLFVSIKSDGDEGWLSANELPEDAIEDNGPTLVATYKLVGKRTLIRAMQEVPKKRRKR